MQVPDQNFFWELAKISDSTKEVSREIGFQKNYFSEKLLKWSTAFESWFPDFTSFESRIEFWTLLPPKTKKKENMNSQNKNLKPTFARKMSLVCDLRFIKCDPTNARSCVGEGMLMCPSATCV